METTQQVSQQAQRDEKGRFLKGVSGNPNGAPKGRNQALFEIEEAIEEFSREKGIGYWKSATLIAIKLAHEGNTSLLQKILDKFVASKNIHEIEGGLGKDRTIIIQFGELHTKQEVPVRDASGTAENTPSV